MQDGFLSHSYVYTVLFVGRQVVLLMLLCNQFPVLLDSGLELRQALQAKSCQVLKHISFTSESAVVGLRPVELALGVPVFYLASLLQELVPLQFVHLVPCYQQEALVLVIEGEP